MNQLNNYVGYVVATFVPREDSPDVAGTAGQALSNVVGRRSGEWRVSDEPLVIYPTVTDLIESIGPSFNKKTHLICEVIIHISGERVEIVSV